MVVLIVVVAALVLISAAGLLRPDTGSSSVKDSPLVEKLKEWLITGRRAKPADFRCTCLVQSEFHFALSQAPGWSAEATVVADSKTELRKASMKLKLGQRAQIRYEPSGKDAVPVRFSIESGEVKDLSILKEGGVLKLRCVRPEPQGICVLLFN